MEKPKEKKSVFEQIKNKGTKKISRVVVVIFFIFAMVFATIVNLGFKSFDFTKWLSNSLIMVGILIFGLVTGEGSGQDHYRELINGTYRFNVEEYRETNKRVKPYINNFDFWFNEQLPKELENKKINFLIKNGIRRSTAINIVKYCKLNDLDNLIHDEAIKKVDLETQKDIYIEKIEEYQIDAVKWVLEGKIKLDTPNSYYFITLYNDELNDITIFEQGKSIVKQRKKVRDINRGLKIATSIIVSAIWASLTVYEMMAIDSLESWMNLISRIAGLLTAISSGFMGSKATVNLESRQIKNKTDILALYESDILTKKFIIKDEQEILKEKYENQVKKDEEIKKNVVTPDEILEESKEKDPINSNVIMLENNSNKIEKK